MWGLLSSCQTAASSRGVPTNCLSHLHCPYCGFELELEAEGARAEKIVYGVLRCACYEYPIVEGIPILRQVEGLGRVVRFIGRGEFPAALWRTLNLFRTSWVSQNRWRKLLHNWACFQQASGNGGTFAEAARRLRKPTVLADYLVHRYANPSFLAAIGPLFLLEYAAVRAPFETAKVLDLACGAGHASFLIRLLFPELSVISADADFVNLYLARRFIVPDGLQLCVDAQAPIPLPDHSCHAVYCQDAFHYFVSKKATIQELKRILGPNGLWIFPHLHNRLCHNPVPGVPMSPEGYLKCFDLANGRLFAESDLLHGLVSESGVDFSATASSAHLDRAPALTFVSGGSELWRQHRQFPAAFCKHKQYLRVNPIYCQASNGQSLELRWPNLTMQQECRATEAILTRHCELGAAQWTRFQRGEADPAWLANLVARFVLVPLPHGYCRSDP